jgi:hexokinase
LTSSAQFKAPSTASVDALSLGLTFSFPVEQQDLDSGILLTWTKGFSARNAAGNDVVKLLQDAFDRKHIHVKCVALVNDVRSYFSLTYAVI